MANDWYWYGNVESFDGFEQHSTIESSSRDWQGDPRSVYGPYRSFTAAKNGAIAFYNYDRMNAMEAIKDIRETMKADL